MHFFNDILQHYSWQGTTLVLLTVTLFFIQLYYYAIAYNRIIGFRLLRAREKRRDNPPVSVIVPMRGESERFLVDELPALLHQDYAHYEVVVVYIGGDSDYYDELQRIRDNHSYMRLTKMGGNERLYISTKQALNVGIKSAQYDCLLFTIPNATPISSDWVATMAKGFERGSVVIAPAVPNFEGKSLSTYLMRLIEFNMMRNAMARAVVGKPYYAPRSNYGFDRSLYERTRGYNHLKIDIGENDLYIQSITRPQRCAVMLSPKALVYEERPSTWNEWLDVVRYNRSTGSYYPIFIKTFESWETGSRALFFLATLAALILLPLELKIFALGLALLRYIIVVFSTRKTAQKLGERGIILKYWMYDLLGPAIDYIINLKRSNNSPKAWI